MVTIVVEWGTDYFNYDRQTKNFQDEMKAIEWCRRNHDKIQCINGTRTFGKLLSHFAIMDCIKKGE